MSIALLLGLLMGCVVVHSLNGDVYKIGVGIADITGPAAEINMVGRIFYSFVRFYAIHVFRTPHFVLCVYVVVPLGDCYCCCGLVWWSVATANRNTACELRRFIFLSPSILFQFLNQNCKNFSVEARELSRAVSKY